MVNRCIKVYQSNKVTMPLIELLVAANEKISSFQKDYIPGTVIIQKSVITETQMRGEERPKGCLSPRLVYM